MAKRKVIRKSNKPLNIFDGGGKMSGFEEFINSDTFQGIQKGISTFNLGASSSQGQPNFLSMNQSKGSGLMGSIGSAVDTTGQLLSGIDTLLTKKRKPLAQTVGLISSDGRRLYAGGGGLEAGDYMNMGTTALALAGNAVQQAQIEDTSDLKEQVKQYGNVQVKSDNFDDLMNDWASRTELQHISAKDLRNKSLFGDFANSLSASGQGFAAGSAAGPIGAAVGGIVGGVSSVIGSIIGRNKAKKEAKRVNKQIDIANARNLQAYEDKAQNIDAQNDFGTMASFAAFGGPLGIWGGYGSGAIGYELAKENLGIKALNAANKGKLTSLPNSFESSELNTFAKGGKIHIKPENRGKFTKYCGGKVTSECIARGKRSSDPAVRKRATFAANARKWHHAFGGDLLTHGAEWDNGLRVIGNGGTHEENPMEGVPMGMDAEGTPNLVEQGEVIFNDYVFSNRLFADGGLLESFNLPKSYDGYSFAAIAEKLGEESKERPNDPISKRGLLSSMSRLQQAQETVRQQNQVGQEGVQYAHGGRMGTLFDGLGQYPNHLLVIDDDNVPEGTMFDPISNRYVFTGYQDSDDNPLNFGSGITPSGEWVEEPKYMARAAAKRAGYDVGSSLDDYNKNPIKVPEKKKSAVSRLLSNLDATDLRYAPVVGAAIGLGQNLFSRPDYTSANAILEAANQAGNYTPVGYTPIGNYLQYRPLDRNYYINKLNAQAGATRRAIMNTTSPSRNAVLLAADYNAQGRLGDLARQAEEYNLAQRQAVETFNRGTNMANAEMGLKAAMANQEAALKARSSRLSGVAQAMAVRDAVDARRGASMSANLTNFFNSLGDIGREEYSRNMIMSNPALYYSIDSKGNVTYKNGYENLSEAEKKEVRDAANEAKKKKKAKGGYLTIKKK